jgi:RNA polymerase sigma-70 factor (ECF subfamily)
MPHNEIQIRELIKKAQGGDETALNRLVLIFGKPVFNFILKMVKNRHTAEDIYQETWLRAYRNLPRYRESGSFQNWLFKIANRLCLNHFRSVKSVMLSISEIFDNRNGMTTHELPAGRHTSPDSEMERQEAIALVESALRTMPLKQKQVFLLRVQADLPFKEIAEILQRPLNTVLTQMRAALTFIQKKLSEHYDEVQYR